MFLCLVHVLAKTFSRPCTGKTFLNAVSSPLLQQDNATKISKSRFNKIYFLWGVCSTDILAKTSSNTARFLPQLFT